MRTLPSLLAVAMIACGAPAERGELDHEPATPSDNIELVGTSWSLEELGSAPALPGVEATLTFPEAGRATGRGSCNQFSGPVEIGDATIDFGDLAATRMHCGDEIMEQETRFLAALAAAQRYEAGPSMLRLEGTGATDEIVLIRRRE